MFYRLWLWLFEIGLYIMGQLALLLDDHVVVLPRNSGAIFFHPNGDMLEVQPVVTTEESRPMLQNRIFIGQFLWRPEGRRALQAVTAELKRLSEGAAPTDEGEATPE
jgi:hypothetical protein